MRIFVRGGPEQEVFLLTGQDARERGNDAFDFDSDAEALDFLGHFDDPRNMAKLRRVLGENSQQSNISSLSDHEVIQHLAAQLHSGRVKAVSAFARHGVARDGDVGNVDEGRPTAPLPRELTWIKIHVVEDRTGEPIQGVTLTVKLPDGSKGKYTTDAEGLIDIDGIEPGHCDAESEIGNAPLSETYGVVRMGGSWATKPTPPRLPAWPFAVIEEHRVRSGETLESLAKASGLTEARLCKFNWDTTDPKKVDELLRTEVGCTKKSDDKKRYVFDDADDPGIVRVPKKWETKGLATAQSHVVRVAVLRIMPQIEHVVVLMLENRGFDHLLGFLYDDANPPPKHQPPRPPADPPRARTKDELRAFEGLSGLGALANPFNVTDKAENTHQGAFHPVRGVRAPNVPTINPHENFVHIMEDLYNCGHEDMRVRGVREARLEGKDPAMNGWVQNYADSIEKHVTPVANREEEPDAYKQQMNVLFHWQLSQIMDMYVPEQLPVLSGLARHYAVSDQWFCSVPSQTNANRAFSVAGCSAGLVTNNFYDFYLEKWGRQGLEPYIPFAGEMVKPLVSSDLQRQVDALRDGYTGQNFVEVVRADETVEGGSTVDSLPGRITLFDVLDNKGIEWRYHWSASAMPPAGSIMGPYLRTLFIQYQDARYNAHFPRIQQFYEDAASGDLAPVTFIEPILGGGKAWDGFLRIMSNDFHPVGDSICPEHFVKSIYDAVSQGPKWSKTVLIVTFDENGGTYDHFPPPRAVAPGPKFDKAPAWQKDDHAECDPGTMTQFGFGFDRYGCRVPTLLISPYVEPGTVFRSPTGVPYDHTSLIATILKWQGIDPKSANLGARVAGAPTFEGVLSGDLRPKDDPQAGIHSYGRTLLGDRGGHRKLKYGDMFYLFYVGTRWGVWEKGGYLQSETPYRGYLGGPDTWRNYWYPVIVPTLENALKWKLTGGSGQVLNGSTVEIVAQPLKGALGDVYQNHRLCAPGPVERSNAAERILGRAAVPGLIGKGLGNETKSVLSLDNAFGSTVWLDDGASARSRWVLWLLRDRDETTPIHEDDEVLIFTEQTVPGAAWNLHHQTLTFPADPYQKLTVQESPDEDDKRYAQIRAGEWDIWRIVAA